MSQAHDNQTNMDAIRAELNTLRSQLENLLKNADAKRSEVTDDVAGKLARELEHYRKLASRGTERLREAGSAGIEEVTDQVRKNPVTSLLVAFGAGCIISALLRNLR